MVLRSRSPRRMVSSCNNKAFWALCKRVSTPFLSTKRKGICQSMEKKFYGINVDDEQRFLRMKYSEE